MRIHDVLASGRKSVSFEFFPPKGDAGEATLWQAIRRVEAVHPTFVSVTYGAGGSTRDRTVSITARIAQDTSLMPMAHLTCVGSSVAELRQIIGEYADAGVLNVMALRGDPPGGLGQPWVAHPEGLDHADQLVTLIRSLGTFDVGVAAFPHKHPESVSLAFDAQVLAAKARAGASFAITQLFFDVESYIELCNRVADLGCNIPIVPGLMPLTTFSQVERFAQLGGTPLPNDLADKLTRHRDDPQAVREIGMAAVTELASELLTRGAPGIHFYTLNQSTASLEIFDELGLADDVAQPGGPL